MSASLVGSEMCIRDRPYLARFGKPSLHAVGPCSGSRGYRHLGREQPGLRPGSHLRPESDHAASRADSCRVRQAVA
eukprot:7215087-Alexandrium_andersonii.AAC.1